MKTIILTGPESSGKSTLVNKLHKIYGGIIVLEYAREFLKKTKGEYYQNDLLKIAKGQLKLQQEAFKSDSEIVFFDTDLLTIKIWSKYKYNSCDNYIINELNKKNDSLYILCKPDFDWKEDVLRENPNDREELYEIYKSELINYGFTFIEVGGSVENRIKTIKKHLK